MPKKGRTKETAVKVATLKDEIAILEEKKLTIGKEIDTIEAEMKIKRDDLAVELAAIQSNRDNANKLKEDLEAGLESYKTLVKEQSHKLKEVNNEIQSRQSYFKGQEEVIEKTIHDWNTNLQEFAQDNKIANDEKIKLLTENDRLKTENLVLKAKSFELNRKKEALEELYNEKASEYKDKLTFVRVEIAKAVESRDSVIQERQGTIKKAESLIAEANIKRQALAQEAEDIENQKRQLKSNASLLQ